MDLLLLTNEKMVRSEIVDLKIWQFFGSTDDDKSSRSGFVESQVNRSQGIMQSFISEFNRKHTQLGKKLDLHKKTTA